MTTGTIKKLVSDRGFGFIASTPPQPDGRDLFFHRADVGGTGFDSLREGQNVTYVLGNDERRGTPKALQVKAV
jgi:cold shock protein